MWIFLPLYCRCVMPLANAPSKGFGALARGITHPCILEEVVNRRTLGH
ncbi:hypothetical protein [Fischerella sp. PCC 9605]|nr:hypothetical protein [Fischerella sp. PCC 9605]